METRQSAVLRKKIARYTVVMKTELAKDKMDYHRDAQLDNEFYYIDNHFTDQAVSKRIKDNSDNDVSNLERCIRDYGVSSTFIRMICEEKTNVNFKIKNTCGIYIKTHSGKTLALLSTGKLAELSPVDDTGNKTKTTTIKEISAHDAIGLYGTDADLEHALEKSIGVVVLSIQDQHKRKHPEFYVGVWPDVSKEQAYDSLVKRDKSRRA